MAHEAQAYADASPDAAGQRDDQFNEFACAAEKLCSLQFLLLQAIWPANKSARFEMIELINSKQTSKSALHFIEQTI